MKVGKREWCCLLLPKFDISTIVPLAFVVAIEMAFVLVSLFVARVGNTAVVAAASSSWDLADGLEAMARTCFKQDCFVMILTLFLLNN